MKHNYFLNKLIELDLYNCTKLLTLCKNIADIKTAILTSVLSPSRELFSSPYNFAFNICQLTLFMALTFSL